MAEGRLVEGWCVGQDGGQAGCQCMKAESECHRSQKGTVSPLLSADGGFHGAHLVRTSLNMGLPVLVSTTFDDVMLCLDCCRRFTSVGMRRDASVRGECGCGKAHLTEWGCERVVPGVWIASS